MRLGSAVALAALGGILASLPGEGQALTTTITFNGLSHGRIVDTDFAAQGLAQIVTTNLGGGPNYGVIFDTHRTGTEDPDLEDPWNGGNLPSNTALGGILIIQENTNGCGDDVCNKPDDEGSRPAGSFDLLFSTSLSAFGLDLVDIENTSDEPGLLVFFDGANQVSRSWSDLKTADPSIVWGDNFINRVAPITAASIGLSEIDRVLVQMGGSGGLDNLVLVEREFPPVAEPTLIGVAALLGALAAARRR
jgi:hypothetical protein